LRAGVSGVAASSKSRPAAYRRHEPETTALHKIVRDSLEPFLHFTRDNYSKPLPKYVERELKRYVGCGRLERGFTRLRCPRCGADMLLAFSCKARICPFARAGEWRRVGSTSSTTCCPAHLCDNGSCLFRGNCASCWRPRQTSFRRWFASSSAWCSAATARAGVSLDAAIPRPGPAACNNDSDRA
jgi:hypothetical protein